MIHDSNSAAVYTDFQGLMRLKVEAGKQTPEAIEETARQFEAIFVQTMLKAMRDASPGEGMFESDQTDFYRQMYDQQLALHMVKGNGLGIADMLVSRLQGEAAGVEKNTAELDGESIPIHAFTGEEPVQPLLEMSAGMPVVPVNSSASLRPLVRLSGQVVAEVVSTDRPIDNWRPDSPAAFIRDLAPHAEKAAVELGVKADVLIAQAALESGWGKQVIRHADGRNSFNLFGIKADRSWSGDKVSVATLEYENGIAEKQHAVFRSYHSLDEATADYADFIRSNPRYQQALAQAGDPEAYLRGLKAAGYATDPDYVEKIRAIMQQDSFAKNMQKLELS